VAFVNAYNNETGEKQRVPEHWLGDASHPQFGKFTKTPRQKASEKQAGKAETTNAKES